MKIAIQGVEGSFHHQAALEFFDADIEIVGCETFEQVFAAVSAGVVDRGMVACENSLYGSINSTYDQLLLHTPHIVGEQYVHVALQLLCTDDTNLTAITDVYSQAPALAEARAYLRTNAPQAKLHEYPDTAMSARYIAKANKSTYAAIASRAAGEIYKLQVLADDIEDHPHNYTRFFVIAKNPSQIINANKTTLILKTDHAPGALHAALGTFSAQGLNLSKIESRPILAKNKWRYIFYLDIDASTTQPEMKTALTALEEAGYEATILGSYERTELPPVGN